MQKSIENKLRDVRLLYRDIIYKLLDTKQKILNAMDKFQSINRELCHHIELIQIGKFIE